MSDPDDLDLEVLKGLDPTKKVTLILAYAVRLATDAKRESSALRQALIEADLLTPKQVAEAFRPTDRRAAKLEELLQLLTAVSRAPGEGKPS